MRLKEDRETPTLQVVNDLRREMAQIPGARIFVRTSDLVSQMVTGGTQRVEVVIFGDDLGTLSRLAGEVMRACAACPATRTWT